MQLCLGLHGAVSVCVYFLVICVCVFLVIIVSPFCKGCALLDDTLYYMSIGPDGSLENMYLVKLNFLPYSFCGTYSHVHENNIIWGC